MRHSAAAAILALTALTALPAAAIPGFFVRDAAEPKEATAPELKTSSTCSLWARYDPDHVVWQEQHFLGGPSLCGGFQGFFVAASAAAIGLPSWETYGFQKDGAPSLGPSGPYPGWPYQCSVNIDFEPSTPSKVVVTFTGAAACMVQRNRVLAVVKGGMSCMVTAGMCPWSNP